MPIIDRRENYKDRSSSSKKRFVKRFRKKIGEDIDNIVGNSDGFTDILSKGNRKVRIKGNIDEPEFVYERGGKTDTVLPGNDRYVPGDTVSKPPKGGGGGGSNPSRDGFSEDDFEFVMNHEEFMDLLFEELELPDMVKRSMAQTATFSLQHDGFSSNGAPGDLDVARTLKMSLGRKVAIGRKRRKDRIEEIDALLADMVEDGEHYLSLLQERLVLVNKLKSLPFLDPVDLKYRRREIVPAPTSQAVMFCLMDVSASMSEHHKTLAKYFFLMLYTFLKKNYNKIDLVFIKHTHEAKEVDEYEFFNGRESGGTVVLSALEMCLNVIKERYDTAEWNVYVAQASDGDSFGDDAAECEELLVSQLLPATQYMVYTQIGGDNELPGYSALWDHYDNIIGTCDNFDMAMINNKADIYPVFRQLFSKKAS